jgi:hypothetical protein
MQQCYSGWDLINNVSLNIAEAGNLGMRLLPGVYYCLCLLCRQQGN